MGRPSKLSKALDDEPIEDYMKVPRRLEHRLRRSKKSNPEHNILEEQVDDEELVKPNSEEVENENPNHS